ncbi:hypothetical protein COLO4_28861 [Corchorus olitorius]|uniref:Nudix hydrolase domain-containing protein n=1 Tax=Corchorus olitorius TaxID=93759 RepID=A0A1R3HHU0_9ROSI|nr:hypothetical protein COLO4_28861 [Corchorus olitorius]
MVSRVSFARTGRHLQRYDNRGFRLVVGCIPYRYRKTKEEEAASTSTDEEIEVLVISAQNGKGMLFPKGGWEKDESMEEAAIRETLEEAGVLGNIEVTVSKAKQECPHLWMREALEELVRRHMQQQEEVNRVACN